MIAAGRRSKTSSTALAILAGSTCSVPNSLDHQRHRPGDPDGIGDLDLAALGRSRGDDVLGDPARRVGRGTVHLGRVFAGKRPAAVAGRPSVGVDDDLPPGQTGVGAGAAELEPAGRVGKDFVAVVGVLRRARSGR